MKFTQKQYLAEIVKLQKHADAIAKNPGRGTNAYKNCCEALTRLRIALYADFPNTQSAQPE